LTIKSQTFNVKTKKFIPKWKLTLYHSKGSIKPSKGTAKERLGDLSITDSMEILKYFNLYSNSE
jgi:hypothetical protein